MFMFPGQNLFLCFQLSIQVKDICQSCDLVAFKFIKKSGNILRQRESFVDFSLYLFHLGHIKADELLTKYYFLTPKACLNTILAPCLWFLSCHNLQDECCGLGICSQHSVLLTEVHGRKRSQTGLKLQDKREAQVLYSMKMVMVLQFLPQPFWKIIFKILWKCHRF